MSKKDIVKASKRIEKNLMKLLQWKGYAIGFEDGRREGAVQELHQLKTINEDFLQLELGLSESSIEAITIFRKAWIKYRAKVLESEKK